ncbi:hypothetical protein H2203_004157 [Taxawa tesnikishii (nom. ined.)]|nr:hypothetical protein H2203_004157 [Dothideales sp. JES 119]
MPPDDYDFLARVRAPLGAAYHATSQVPWSSIPTELKTWIKNNPKQTAFMIAVIVFCPAMLSAPALAALGFTSAGPAAGSAAAFIQSTLGTAAAFSAMQSAAMGGYGIGATNGVGAAIGAAGGALAWKKGNRKADADGKQSKRGPKL